MKPLQIKPFVQTLTTLAVAGILTTTALQTWAGGGGFGGGNFGGRTTGAARGQVSVRQAVLGRVQQTIGFSNDEWVVIEPKLWRVVSLQLALGQGPALQAGGFARGRGGAGNNLATQAQAEEDAPVAELSRTLEQLRQQLESYAGEQGASIGQYTATMTQYRETENKLEAALAAAEKELQSVLTVRQEALLLAGNYLN